jgi:phage gpG-like protein
VIEVKVEGTIPEIAVGGRDTMEECSRIMLDGIQRTFYEGGYPGRWAPLRSKPFGPATLFRTGRLFGSLRPDSDEDSAEVSVPGTLRYGAYLHYGTRKMVARPFMLWREDMIEQVMDVVGESVRFEQSLPTGWNP